MALGHGMLLLATQSSLELKRINFSPGKLSTSQLGELTAMHGDASLQNRLGLFRSLGLGQPTVLI